MSRFDRYLLSQLMVLFGFFALVLVLVYWVNRAVVLFDQLIADGQSALVFLEFTALTLPNVIRLVLPMSAFAAAVYVTNRLSSESELTVMQATGFSPWRLARPVVFFGLIIASMMAALTHYLVPASLDRLSARQYEISRNVTARMLTEGTFLHPAAGVTFYIREITPEGQLLDVFLSDRRQDDETIIYTASEAYLVRDEDAAKLIMIDGLSQYHSTDGGRLFTTNFADFTYDLGDFLSVASGPPQSVRHMMTLDLLRNSQQIADRMGITKGYVVEEAHARFSQPLLCLVAALVGFSTLLVGGFSRFGVWRQVFIAFVLLVVIEMFKSAVADPVRSNHELWPITYVPPALGFFLTWALLFSSAHPPRLGQKLRRLRTS